MKIPIGIIALTGALLLGACATTKKQTPPPARISGAAEIDKSIIDPTTPSDDPLGTPPIPPEQAK